MYTDFARKCVFVAIFSLLLLRSTIDAAGRYMSVLMRAGIAVISPTAWLEPPRAITYTARNGVTIPMPTLANIPSRVDMRKFHLRFCRFSCCF